MESATALSDNMLVLPIIEYSSFLWGYKAYSDIEKIQNNLKRSFLGVGRNASIVALIGDMGWLPIATISKLNCIRFWLRLSNMTNCSQRRLRGIMLPRNLIKILLASYSSKCY